MEPENHLFERKIIFQTFTIVFHVNFQGCHMFQSPKTKMEAKNDDEIDTMSLIFNGMSFRNKHKTNINDNIQINLSEFSSPN